MQHHFEVDDATRYGVEKAILINNFRFWIAKNEANRKNKHDGKYWTYNSARAFSELFPYWKRQKIARLLREMENEGLIDSGIYNTAGYDRTKWYTLGKAIVHILTMDSSEMDNGVFKSEQPIPDIKPDSKPNKEYSPEFEVFWTEYPRKINKAGAFKTWKARLKEGVTAETLMTCLGNYKAKLKADKTEPNFILHAKTFLNAGHRFEDYKTAGEAEIEQATYVDKFGNQYRDGVKIGHWDGGRFIPDMSQGVR